jgi:hypothetical protein
MYIFSLWTSWLRVTVDGMTQESYVKPGERNDALITSCFYLQVFSLHLSSLGLKLARYQPFGHALVNFTHNALYLELLGMANEYAHSKCCPG